MLYDPSVNDAAFAKGRAPDNIDAIITTARRYLGLNGADPWRLISGRRRFGKTLFEIERTTAAGPERLIGKVCKTERAEALYSTLATLREYGFQPPAKFTVPQPVACIPKLGFILQEKVPGFPSSDLILGAEPNAAAEAARWLVRLHRSHLKPPIAPNSADSLIQWSAELAHKLPQFANDIQAVADATMIELGVRSDETVACHADFHPMNIFIEGDKRVTAIDIDKFCRDAPESDLGSFLMQTAAFDFFENSSFARSAEARRVFLTTYEGEIERRVNRAKTAAYIAKAFLKNLHFEVVLLDTGSDRCIEPWLKGAKTAIFDRNIYLSA